jgi:hypothetical protein
MKHLSRVTPCLALLVCLVGQGLLVAPAAAQVTYLEAETTGGANDTFALAEDCRLIGNRFVIKGTVHQGNSNSDDEWFQFVGAAGACVNIDFNITQATPVGTYQLNVWLYNSSETLVAAWHTATASSSANFGIGAYTLPATDTYYIYVTEWSVAPNALTQPGIVFTPLSVRGYGVTGTTPNSTRNTAGGNQTFGSLYEITVSVSSGNEAPFDVWVDCDATTGAVVCSPDPASVCWLVGAGNVRFMASPKCPPTGVNVNILGGGSGIVLPGTTLTLNAPGPEVSTTYTVDNASGPQPGGTIQTVQALVTQGGQAVSQVDVCAGIPICLDVCAQPGSTYLAALSETLGPPIPIPPFLPALELNTNSILFGLTFPVNQISPLLTGAQGQPPGQVCLALPPGIITAPAPIYLQVVTFTTAGVTGLSPKVTLNLVP